MNNTEEVIKHIGAVIAGLEGIKSALSGEITETKEEKVEKVTIDTKVLADRLANSYTTLHPEYRIESQFRNLQDMANNSRKISILFSWLRNHDEGIEEFFKLPQSKKQEVLNATLASHEDLIKTILKQRFAQ